jgi:hypothetical protein
MLSVLTRVSFANLPIVIMVRLLDRTNALVLQSSVRNAAERH